MLGKLLALQATNYYTQGGRTTAKPMERHLVKLLIKNSSISNYLVKKLTLNMNNKM